MTTYRTIVHVLFNERNPWRAIRLTIDRDPDNAYSFYTYCRQHIFRDDRHRHPEYVRRVRDLQSHYYRPEDPDWDLLSALMASPVRQQYRVETTRQRYLSNYAADQALKGIPSLFPEFYEYRMPYDIVEEATDRIRQRREAKHSRPITISNIDFIIATAKNWFVYKHPWDLVACASILCGRRTQEIVRDMTYEPAGEFLLEVEGLCKQLVGEGTVPLLIEADKFMELMAKIREHHLPVDSSTHRLKPAFKRIFGRWYNHSERRNIYCEAAWRMRNESGFYPQMSKIMWFDKALCHDGNVIHQASNLTYHAANFEDE